MSGTTFKAQKILSESIMTESPELIETIISNPEIRRVAEEFWKDIGRLLTDVQENKTEEVVNYVKTCQERLAKNTSLESSYKKLTTMINAIEKKLYLMDVSLFCPLLSKISSFIFYPGATHFVTESC